ncbi:MAG: hypothetical protein ABSG16_08455 [Candidatus Acidiferrum sp.]|jgi:hypothetical protein
MSARSTTVHLLTKAAIAFAALFLVSVLLAAMPGHRAPIVPSAQNETPPGSAPATAPQQGANHSTMAGMKMDGDEKASEGAAVEDMSGMHHNMHSLHMYMTTVRPQAAGDAERANQIVKELRAGIDKYKDYHMALSDGYKIFLPNIPQPEYHFTSRKNGFLEAFSFDASRPTSLLYKKTATGYELVGAMYTMPRRASEEQLNERVPLSVATWHLHTNLCAPPLWKIASADWTKFGLQGSIATQEACDAAGGRFHPVVLGWMTHVYPYEDSFDKMFAMHMD